MVLVVAGSSVSMMPVFQRILQKTKLDGVKCPGEINVYDFHSFALCQAGT